MAFFAFFFLCFFFLTGLVTDGDAGGGAGGADCTGLFGGFFTDFFIATGTIIDATGTKIVAETTEEDFSVEFAGGGGVTIGLFGGDDVGGGLFAVLFPGNAIGEAAKLLVELFVELFPVDVGGRLTGWLFVIDEAAAVEFAGPLLIQTPFCPRTAGGALFCLYCFGKEDSELLGAGDGFGGGGDIGGDADFGLADDVTCLCLCFLCFLSFFLRGGAEGTGADCWFIIALTIDTGTILLVVFG